MRRFSLSTLFLLLLFSACSKHSSKLGYFPKSCLAATDDCMRCDILGKEWTPVGDGWANLPYQVEYSPEYDALSVNLSRKVGSTEYSHMYMAIYNVRHGDPYIYVGTGQIVGLDDLADFYPCGYMKYSPDYSCTLDVIKNDTANDILEARFTLTLVNPECGIDSLLYVTNGQFAFYY